MAVAQSAPFFLASKATELLSYFSELVSLRAKLLQQLQLGFFADFHTNDERGMRFVR